MNLDFMSNYYRLDGSPYTGTFQEQVLAWAHDFEDNKGRVVRQEYLWNGLWVSTVWLGVDHGWGMSDKPLIFETMVFDDLTGADADTVGRWATLQEAEAAHRWTVERERSLRSTLRRWWAEANKREE